jgi:hypothetical protein
VTIAAEFTGHGVPTAGPRTTEEYVVVNRAPVPLGCGHAKCRFFSAHQREEGALVRSALGVVLSSLKDPSGSLPPGKKSKLA